MYTHTHTHVYTKIYIYIFVICINNLYLCKIYIIFIEKKTIKLFSLKLEKLFFLGNFL